MTVKLSEEQREALKRHGDVPLYVTNTESQEQYVLLPAEEYERVRPLLEDDAVDFRELYPLVEHTFRKGGWDDPKMDEYNDYDTHRKQT